jgi:hypothetical protein
VRVRLKRNEPEDIRPCRLKDGKFSDIAFNQRLPQRKTGCGLTPVRYGSIKSATGPENVGSCKTDDKPILSQTGWMTCNKKFRLLTTKKEKPRFFLPGQ